LASHIAAGLPADRTHCVNESPMSGESSYAELLTCQEMARDVRAVREHQAKAHLPAAAKLPKTTPSRSSPPPAPVPASPIARCGVLLLMRHNIHETRCLL
jgi:hypothetical protein